jgi:hypothetical protein
MRNSNRNRGWATMKAGAGGDFTITLLFVSRLTAFWFPRGAVFPPQSVPVMLDYAPPNRRKNFGRVVRRIRPERHNPHSIATLRIIMARSLVDSLPHCPCCGSRTG